MSKKGKLNINTEQFNITKPFNILLHDSYANFNYNPEDKEENKKLEQVIKQR
jgi:hypothetical protein